MLSGKSMLAKTLSLILPALFPSWRFFREVGPAPVVEYRVFYPGFSPDWQPARHVPEHVPFSQMLLRLFWSPDWNEGLFLVSCAERLAADPDAPLLPAIEKRIARTLSAPAQATLQVRISFVWHENGIEQRYVDFESDPRPVSGILK